MVMYTATEFSCKFSNIFIFKPVKCPAKRENIIESWSSMEVYQYEYLIFNLFRRSDATQSVSLLLKYL